MIHDLIRNRYNQMKTSQSGQVKYIGPSYLYNMLQDFRHLIVFDFRQDFQKLHIRDAFHVHAGLNRQQLMEVIDLAETKAAEKQEKYKTIKKIRRYFFVGEKKIDPSDVGMQFVLNCLSERQSKEDKFYALSQGFDSFIKNYPFILVDEKKLKQAHQKGKQEYEKVLLYPYAKFPSQIIPNKLYLGNVYSSNSHKQLEDMGITCLVDFIDYSQEQKVPEFKHHLDQYQCIPINKDVPVVLDFDQINKKIDELVGKGKVLLYCKDGETISPAFAISYLMYKAKLDVSTATLKVCQAISRVQLNKMVYGQLLVYKPKQTS